ncbi:Conserved_hypothetical protein [Hexamita inflata]|uniref:Uncharacterized protein n=1 Tax=Hexamita inflata TaxID=28002 RepID=A0AA86QZC3_9EUKA|nr:Conserved hypothetical protein [Hexamita inflata]
MITFVQLLLQQFKQGNKHNILHKYTTSNCDQIHIYPGQVNVYCIKTYKLNNVIINSNFLYSNIFELQQNRNIRHYIFNGVANIKHLNIQTQIAHNQVGTSFISFYPFGDQRYIRVSETEIEIQIGSEYANCAFITKNIEKIYIYGCQFKLLALTVDQISALFYNIENTIQIEGTTIIFTFQGEIISGLAQECNAQINISSLNIQGQITGSQLTVFYGISKELNSQVYLNQSSIQIEYDTLQAFYGLTYLTIAQLVINQIEFNIIGTQTEVFFGLAHQLDLSQIENSAFNFQISSQKSYALIEVQVGTLSINNITVSGTITGNEIYGLVYEAQASVVIDSIIFSLVMNGANSCAFVFKITGSGQVSYNNISFTGIQNNPISPSAMAIGLTCPCPLGAQLVKGVCHCTANSTFDPDSKTCKCISGPLIDGVCCPINSIMINSVCVCQPINTVLDNGECKCAITGQQLASIDSNVVCVCTVAGAQPVSGTCKCPQNAFVKDNTCTCPSGSTILNNICTCSTASSIINTSLAEPICQCPVGSTNSSNSCQCPQNSIIQNKACVCTTQNQFIENGVCRCPINGTIICPTGASLIENQCVCTSDYAFGVWVSSGNAWCTNINLCCTKCALKIGNNWGCSDDNYHTCSNSGTTVLGITPSCDCPAGSTIIGNTCTCSIIGAYPYNNVCQCPTNAYILNNVCTCPTGSSLINGACLCSTQNSYPDLTLSQPACQCPQYSTNISNICVCPTSSTASGKICVCQITYSTMQNGVCTCPVNSTNVSNVCTCSSPKIQMSGGVCSCPSGSVFDSFNNQCTCTAQWKYGSTVLPYSFWGLSEGSTNTSQMMCCSSDKNYSGGANSGIRYQCSDSYVTDISSVYFNSDRDFVCGGTTCNPQTWRRM